MVRTSRFEQQLFEDLRTDSHLFCGLPKTWQALQPLLDEWVNSLPEPGSRSDQSAFFAAVWNSSAAFRTATWLIQEPTRLFAGCATADGAESTNTTSMVLTAQSAALQLALYAVVVQLWERVLPRQGWIPPPAVGDAIECLRSLRNAAAHQGGDGDRTHFRFDADTQAVEFRSRDTDGVVLSLLLRDLMLAALLSWLVALRKYEGCVQKDAVLPPADQGGGPTRGCS